MATATTAESWRKVWREGFSQFVSIEGLEALRDALANDDPKLIQGCTTTPPPLRHVQDWPVEAACAVGYCGWKGEGKDKVADVEEFFALACHSVDVALGEPAACRWFLNWFDDTPRDEMRSLLLPEVEWAIATRKADAEDAAEADERALSA